MSITLHLLAGNSPETEQHYFMKGYRNDIILEVNGQFFEVHFFTADALEYEMTKDGHFSFPGMIILDDITLEMIKAAVLNLNDKGFFNHLKSADSLDQATRFIHNWYLNEPSTFDEGARVSLTL